MDWVECKRRRLVPAIAREAKAMKKPYHPPRLTVYGDLTEMTKAKEGGMRQKDGGVVIGMRKT